MVVVPTRQTKYLVMQAIVEKWPGKCGKCNEKKGKRKKDIYEYTFTETHKSMVRGGQCFGSRSERTMRGQKRATTGRSP